MKLTRVSIPFEFCKIQKVKNGWVWEKVYIDSKVAQLNKVFVWNNEEWIIRTIYGKGSGIVCLGESKVEESN